MIRHDVTGVLRQLAGQVFVLGVLAVLMGCRTDGSGGGLQLFKQVGEKWSIQCLEFHGPGSRDLCEAVAEDLRDTPNIVAAKVSCLHNEGYSLLYYGEYYRRTDPQTRKLDMPAQMVNDLSYIKTLRDAAGRPLFLGARKVPYPSPDVGNPEWDLKKADGDFTLQVAVFYNTDTFHDRKQAAADYSADLRSRGYEAYYHHGDSASEVTVGAFKRDNTPSPTGEPSFTPKVRALLRNEQLKYQLENGRHVYRLVDGKKVRVENKLMKIPKRELWP